MLPFPGEFAALATSMMWTASALVFAAATVRVGSVFVNVTRIAAAAAILAGIVILFRIPAPLSAAQIFYLFISGLIGLVFGDTFLFKSYEYNSARISSLVMSTAPAVAALVAWLALGEVLSVLGVLGLAVTLAGIALVVFERGSVEGTRMPLSWVGILYAFLGAVGQAGGLILAKQAFNLGPINGFVATLVRMLAAAVTITPLMRMAGRFSRPVAVFLDDRRAFLLTMLGSVFGPVAGVTLSFIAISYTDVAIAATIMATSPVLMLPVVRVVYRERLSWRAISGAAIAVCGVAMLFLR